MEGNTKLIFVELPKPTKKTKATRDSSGNNDAADGKESTTEEEFPATNSFTEDVLSKHLITKKIFDNLEESDLLSCSVVSKKWNTLARDYLRRHGKACLTFDEINGADDLRSILKLLDSAQNHPFTGVKFLFEKCCKSFFKSEEIKKSFDPQDYRLLSDIFGRIPLKHVQLFMMQKGGLEDSENLRLIFKLLPLEEIEYFCTDEDLMELVPFMDGRRFLKLKELSCQRCFMMVKPDHSPRLVHLLNSCPVLEKVLMPLVDFQMKDFVATNKMHAVKELRVSAVVKPEHILLIDSAELTLRELDIRTLLPRGRHAAFVPSIIKLVRSSSRSMEQLLVTAKFLEYIIKSDVPPLRKVHTVDVWRGSLYNPFQMDGLLKNPLMKKILPNARINVIPGDGDGEYTDGEED